MSVKVVKFADAKRQESGYPPGPVGGGGGHMGGRQLSWGAGLHPGGMHPAAFHSLPQVSRCGSLSFVAVFLEAASEYKTAQLHPRAAPLRRAPRRLPWAPAGERVLRTLKQQDNRAAASAGPP